jgi:hypothetical protein
MRKFVGSQDAAKEIKAAEWVMGSLFTLSSLSEFAAALDKAILETSTPRDFTFAGRTDFISLEDVLQMLAGGGHGGCLSLEKDDNRLDIYMATGEISFLDPHHMIRRVLPSAQAMDYREISDVHLAKAERRRAEEGTPTFLALYELGALGKDDLGKVMSFLGREVLFDFLRDQEDCLFFYRRLDQMPEFVLQHDLRIGVTPTLLEGSRVTDDWQSMCKVFPDPDEPVKPQPDMFARISELALGVLEIKLLAQVNGENSPRRLVRLVGMPLQEIYQHLVALAREGVIVAPGDLSALDGLSIGVEESMQMAFDCLDANDQKAEVASVLDSILGGDEPVADLRTSFLTALQNGQLG